MAGRPGYLESLVCQTCGKSNARRVPLRWRLRYGWRILRRRAAVYGWKATVITQRRRWGPDNPEWVPIPMLSAFSLPREVNEKKRMKLRRFAVAYEEVANAIRLWELVQRVERR